MKQPVPLGLTLQRLYNNSSISKRDGKFLDRMVLDCCEDSPCCYCEAECKALYDDESEYIPADRKDLYRNPTGAYSDGDTWIPQMSLPRLLKQSVYSIASRREL